MLLKLIDAVEREGTRNLADSIIVDISLKGGGNIKFKVLDKHIEWALICLTTNSAREMLRSITKHGIRGHLIDDHIDDGIVSPDEVDQVKEWTKSDYLKLIDEVSEELKAELEGWDQFRWMSDY